MRQTRGHADNANAATDRLQSSCLRIRQRRDDLHLYRHAAALNASRGGCTSLLRQAQLIRKYQFGNVPKRRIFAQIWTPLLGTHQKGVRERISSSRAHALRANGDKHATEHRARGQGDREWNCQVQLGCAIFGASGRVEQRGTGVACAWCA